MKAILEAHFAHYIRFPNIFFFLHFLFIKLVTQTSIKEINSIPACHKINLLKSTIK